VNVKGERRDVPVGTGTAIISTAAAAAAAAAAVSGVTRWTVRGAVGSCPGAAGEETCTK